MVNDAVFAFYRYEESVFSRSGYSYLGLVPLDNIVEGVLGQGAGQGERLQHEGAGGLRHGVQCGRGVLRQMME